MAYPAILYFVTVGKQNNITGVYRNLVNGNYFSFKTIF